MESTEVVVEGEYVSESTMLQDWNFSEYFGIDHDSQCVQTDKIKLRKIDHQESLPMVYLQIINLLPT